MIAEIEKRQFRLQREHSGYLGELTEYRRRIDHNLVEITAKLNGLIGYVDGFRPPPAS